MALDIFLCLIGTLMLVKGADLFVGGSRSIATALGVSPLVIGLTLVSMGTSAPEASVSITGAANGLNDMSLGNIIGSNIFNTLFIIGVSAVIIPVAIGPDIKKYDLPVLMFLYAVLAVFAFAVTPYRLDIYESVVLLALFAGYMMFLFLRAKKQAKRAIAECAVIPSEVKQTERKKKFPIWLSVVFAAVGLAGIIFGGKFTVDGASGLARAWGMSDGLVGLTIVAVGTSLPELVTSVVAAVKGENDIAVGNVIGSNIFNIVFILGASSAVSSAVFNSDAATDFIVMFAACTVVAVISLVSDKITRWQGVLMIGLYVGYLAYIIIRNG